LLIAFQAEVMSTGQLDHQKQNTKTQKQLLITNKKTKLVKKEKKKNKPRWACQVD